ncbi:MAG: hypothetical protein ABFS16_12190 [Bacteroidota bacterium]
MKRITILAAVLLTSATLFAQSLEITPLFGYTFAGKVDNYGRSIDVKDDILYGGILSVEFASLTYAEFSYERNDTRVVTRLDRFDLAVEHYQVGVLRELKEGKVTPFTKVSLGTSRYVQKVGNADAIWLFSAGIGAGAKVFFNERIGLRLFTNLMLPMEYDGLGFSCGIGTGGSGCGGGVTFNVPLVHWDLGAGLIIKLPQ